MLAKQCNRVRRDQKRASVQSAANGRFEPKVPDAAPATKWQKAPNADIAVHENGAMIKIPAMTRPVIKTSGS